MPRRRRHWTDFPSEMIDILEEFSDTGRVAIGPLPTTEAVNTRNELYRFRTAINTAIHERDDISEELIRLHDIARGITIYLEPTASSGEATVVIQRTAFATAPRKLGYEKLTEPLDNSATEAVKEASRGYLEKKLAILVHEAPLKKD